MKVELSIDVDNDAFADGKALTELPRVTREALKRLAYYSDEYTRPAEICVLDVNGNSVGTAEVVGS